MSTPASALDQIGGEVPVNAVFSKHLSHLGGKAWAHVFSRGPSPSAPGSAAAEPVSELRARLDKQPALDQPQRITVRGVFYPAVLLTPGIWERPDPGEGASPIEWRTELQDWLFSGFEEWAPSWDINAGGEDGDDRPLFGQLGHEDEAFSLLVVVTGPGAGALRSELLGDDEMVCNVQLTCSLVHRAEARAAVPARMRTWGKTFDYCLHVDLEQGDEMKRLDAREPYSGYLWECVAPKEWMGDKAVPELVDAFFVWEHTNFASRDARDYGLEALAQKRTYIERRFGELALVQKSAPILPGTPLLAADPFYALVERGAS